MTAMGRHKMIFRYWLEHHATERERQMSYDEQCHAIQMWLQHEENWRLTQKELEEYDAYGNPPARKKRE